MRVMKKVTEPQPRIKLMKLRERFHFTQEEFAIFLGVKQSSIQRYEAGLRTPREKTLKRLKRFCKNRGLKVTLDELIL